MQDGDVMLTLRAFQKVHEAALSILIKRRQRLIHDQHLRLHGQSSCQGDSLFLTARETEWLALKEVGDVHLLSESADGGVDELLWLTSNPKTKADLLAHGHGRKEGTILWHVADASVIGRLVRDVSFTEPCAT